MAENAYRRSLDESLDPGLPGKNSREAEKQEKQARATEKLRAGEEAASGASGGSSEAPDTASGSGAQESGGAASSAVAAGERDVAPGFQFTGGDDKQKTKTKGNFRKFGPIIAIAMAVFGAGSMVGWVQWLMPFAVVEQMTEMFDGSFTARQARMPKIMRWVMNMENDGSKVTTTKKRLGKTYTKYRKMSGKYQKKLAQQGIEVATLEESGEKVLIWRGSEGEPTVIRAGDYDEFYRTNAKFRNDFNRGARGFMGRIAAWIDLSSARFLASHGLTKNLFKDWQEGVFEAEGRNTTFADIIRGRRPEAEVEVGESHSKTQDGADDDGKQFKRHFDADESGEKVNSSTGNSKTKVKTEFANKLVNVANGIANVSCAKAAVSVAAIGIGVSMIHEYAQDYFHGIAEAADRAKAGDGGPINEAGNDLANKMTGQGMITIMSGGKYKPKQDDSLSLLNLNNLYKALKIGATTTVACAISKIAFSSVSIVLSLVPGAGGVKAAAKGIFSVSKVVGGAALGAGVGLLATWGIEKYLDSITTNMCLDSNDQDGSNCLAIGGMSSLQTDFMVGGGAPASKEKVAEFYNAHKLALEYEAEYDRATKSPFDVTSGNTFLGAITRKLMVPIAQISSPAGVLSGLGSVVSSSVSSLLPSASAIDKTEYMENQIGDCPLVESIGGVGNALDCSPIIISDMSTVDTDPEEIVNEIAELGGFEMKDDEIALDENGVEKINADSNLGKYILYCSNRASAFGVVDQNISSQEAGFMTVTSGKASMDAVANGALGAVPILGEVVDIVNSEREIASLGWSTGANCVARDGSDTSADVDGSGIGSENVISLGEELASECRQTLLDMLTGGDHCDDGFTATAADSYAYDTISWEEMSKYQRYVEDDRLIQSAEDGTSAVENFLARYEAENPLDNSFEGVLARNTGMTKANVEIALNEMLYWEYLADYDPTDLYPVPVRQEENTIKNNVANSDEFDGVEGVIEKRIVYTPLRDRNFAI